MPRRRVVFVFVIPVFRLVAPLVNFYFFVAVTAIGIFTFVFVNRAIGVGRIWRNRNGIFEVVVVDI